jgi:hypothetical protein
MAVNWTAIFAIELSYATSICYADHGANSAFAPQNGTRYSEIWVFFELSSIIEMR